MKDRFMRGIIAGGFGGIISSIMNITMTIVLKIGDLVYWDFAGTLIYGRRPNGFWECAFAELGYLGFSGVLGAAFAYLLTIVSSEYAKIKGVIFGLVVWFTAYSLAVLFELAGIERVSLATAAVDYLSSAVYGLTTATALHYLDNRLKAGR